MDRSRPTRACELKWKSHVPARVFPWSRPTRACELKCLLLRDVEHAPRSRPTRACELKFAITAVFVGVYGHALCRRKRKTQKNDTQNAKNSKKIGE